MPTMQPRSGGSRLEGVEKSSLPGKPLVSIVTAVLNGRRTIAQTLDSVAGQTYRNIEHIVIDGGSTDGTVQILESRAPPLDFWVSEVDRGVYDGMNRGLALCRGQIVGIINSDDWYERDAVELVVERHLETPSAIVFGLLRKPGASGEEIARRSADSLGIEMIPHPTVFVPKQVYEKNGLFDPHYLVAADYELMLRNYVKGVRFVRIDRVIATFRTGGMGSRYWLRSRTERAAIQRRYRLITNSVFALRVSGYWLRAARRRARALLCPHARRLDVSKDASGPRGQR